MGGSRESEEKTPEEKASVHSVQIKNENLKNFVEALSQLNAAVLRACKNEKSPRAQLENLFNNAKKAWQFGTLFSVPAVSIISLEENLNNTDKINIVRLLDYAIKLGNSFKENLNNFRKYAIFLEEIYSFLEKYPDDVVLMRKIENALVSNVYDSNLIKAIEDLMNEKIKEDEEEKQAIKNKSVHSQLDRDIETRLAQLTERYKKQSEAQIGKQESPQMQPPSLEVSPLLRTEVSVNPLRTEVLDPSLPSSAVPSSEEKVNEIEIIVDATGLSSLQPSTEQEHADILKEFIEQLNAKQAASDLLRRIEEDNINLNGVGGVEINGVTRNLLEELNAIRKSLLEDVNSKDVNNVDLIKGLNEKYEQLKTDIIAVKKQIIEDENLNNLALMERIRNAIKDVVIISNDIDVKYGLELASLRKFHLELDGIISYLNNSNDDNLLLAVDISVLRGYISIPLNLIKSLFDRTEGKIKTFPEEYQQQFNKLKDAVWTQTEEVYGNKPNPNILAVKEIEAKSSFIVGLYQPLNLKEEKNDNTPAGKINTSLQPKPAPKDEKEDSSPALNPKPASAKIKEEVPQPSPAAPKVNIDQLCNKISEEGDASFLKSILGSSNVAVTLQSDKTYLFYNDEENIKFYKLAAAAIKTDGDIEKVMKTAEIRFNEINEDQEFDKLLVEDEAKKEKRAKAAKAKADQDRLLEEEKRQEDAATELQTRKTELANEYKKALTEAEKIYQDAPKEIKDKIAQQENELLVLAQEIAKDENNPEISFKIFQEKGNNFLNSIKEFKNSIKKFQQEDQERLAAEQAARDAVREEEEKAHEAERKRLAQEEAQAKEKLELEAKAEQAAIDTLKKDLLARVNRLFSNKDNEFILNNYFVSKQSLYKLGNSLLTDIDSLNNGNLVQIEDRVKTFENYMVQAAKKEEQKIEEINKLKNKLRERILNTLTENGDVLGEKIIVTTKNKETTKTFKTTVGGNYQRLGEEINKADNLKDLEVIELSIEEFITYIENLKKFKNAPANSKPPEPSDNPSASLEKAKKDGDSGPALEEESHQPKDESSSPLPENKDDLPSSEAKIEKDIPKNSFLTQVGKVCQKINNTEEESVINRTRTLVKNVLNNLNNLSNLSNLGDFIEDSFDVLIVEIKKDNLLKGSIKKEDLLEGLKQIQDAANKKLNFFKLPEKEKQSLLSKLDAPSSPPSGPSPSGSEGSLEDKTDLADDDINDYKNKLIINAINSIDNTSNALDCVNSFKDAKSFNEFFSEKRLGKEVNPKFNTILFGRDKDRNDLLKLANDKLKDLLTNELIGQINLLKKMGFLEQFIQSMNDKTEKNKTIFREDSKNLISSVSSSIPEKNKDELLNEIYSQDLGSQCNLKNINDAAFARLRDLEEKEIVQKALDKIKKLDPEKDKDFLKELKKDPSRVDFKKLDISEEEFNKLTDKARKEIQSLADLMLTPEAKIKEDIEIFLYQAKKAIDLNLFTQKFNDHVLAEDYKTVLKVKNFDSLSIPEKQNIQQIIKFHNENAFKFPTEDNEEKPVDNDCYIRFYNQYLEVYLGSETNQEYFNDLVKVYKYIQKLISQLNDDLTKANEANKALARELIFKFEQLAFAIVYRYEDELSLVQKRQNINEKTLPLPLNISTYGGFKEFSTPEKFQKLILLSFDKGQNDPNSYAQAEYKGKDSNKSQNWTGEAHVVYGLDDNKTRTKPIVYEKLKGNYEFKVLELPKEISDRGLLLKHLCEKHNIKEDSQEGKALEKMIYDELPTILNTATLEGFFKKHSEYYLNKNEINTFLNKYLHENRVQSISTGLFSWNVEMPNNAMLEQASKILTHLTINGRCPIEFSHGEENLLRALILMIHKHDQIASQHGYPLLKNKIFIHPNIKVTLAQKAMIEKDETYNGTFWQRNCPSVFQRNWTEKGDERPYEVIPSPVQQKLVTLQETTNTFFSSDNPEEKSAVVSKLDQQSQPPPGRHPISPTPTGGNGQGR